MSRPTAAPVPSPGYAAHRERGEPVLRFFLSFAHGEPDDDERVRQFFNDLSTEIRILAGEPEDTIVGLHDEGAPHVDGDWPREQAYALCSAQTLIAMYSPRYFRNECCGREWTVFDRRVRRHQPGAGRPARIIPILWVPTVVPEPLCHIQHWEAEFGHEYRRVGLRRLMRGTDADAYLQLVSAVADRILETIRVGGPLEPVVPGNDLRDVPSAFPQVASDPPASAEPSAGCPSPAEEPAPPQRRAPGGTGRRVARAGGQRLRAPDGPTPPQPRPVLSFESTTASEERERP